jgi:hypothetical protein
MKYQLAALLLLSAPAFADQLPSEQDFTKATEQAVQSVMKNEGWCARAVPAPKSGQVVVYYVRDRHGRCVATFTKGK